MKREAMLVFEGLGLYRWDCARLKITSSGIVQPR